MHWILIRGLARSAGHWGQFATHFERYCQGQMTLIDLPGFGEFVDRPSPDSIEMITQHVIRQIRAKKSLRVRIGAVGISMGGMVASELAARQREWVSHLVLINTSNRRYSKFYQRLLPAAYPTLVRALVTAKPAEKERIIFNLTCHRVEKSASTLAEWQQIHQNYPCKKAAIVRQLQAAMKYQGLHKPPCKKILIVASERDRLVSPDCSKKLAAAWQTCCKIHPTAGHDLPHDDPLWLTNTIDQWLAADSIEKL